MPTLQKCPICGADLASDAPGGHCLRCLWQLALAPDEPLPIAAGDQPLFEQGDRIGRYKLLQQIGEGGCGIVYMAEQEEPVRRRVALKVIKLGMDTKSVIARFEAEQQALALMEHLNIAKVLDAGATDSGRPFFVMELVRGTKITEFCDQNNLSTRERLNLFVQVCNGIQHAHQKGVIHRDIKPSNILVTLNDGVPVPKVIDFGIAKATQQPLTDKTLFTAFEQFIGTPAYMSPEQAEMNASGIDTRSDIYSLGVLLYELLTGQTPFDAKTTSSAGIDEIRRIIREQEPVRPSTRLSTMMDGELTSTANHRRTEGLKLMHLLRGDLDWIVMKALEKDRTRRYETANGLAMDVQRHLHDEPVIARPPGNLYRFQKLVRRNKLVFVGATVIMGVLAIGAVVSSWQAVRAWRAEQTANQQRELAEQQARRAEESRKRADRETVLARRAAAQADARYLLQERLLPAALAKATEAFKLGGEWEDGLLIHDIAAAASERWVLSARVPLSVPATLACVAKAQNGSCLVVSVTGGIRVLDVHTGVIIGSATLAQDVRYLFQGPESNTVVTVSDSAVCVLSLPSLAVAANQALQNPVLCAAATGRRLLLVLREGEVLLFGLPTLAELDSFNWNKNAATKELSIPHQACVSADGNIVLLYGGADSAPMLVWDRRHDPATFHTKKEQINLTAFQFYDSTHFATWLGFRGETDLPSQLHLYDAGQAPAEIASLSIPNDDIKKALEIQSWSSRNWSWEEDFPILGLVGTSGLVMKGMGAPPGDFTTSDRFANLLPTEADSPKFLAADLANGFLALRNHHDLLIFQNSRSPWNGVTLDYCASACRDGLLYINHDSSPASVRAFFIPFDPRQKSARFNLQWPADSKWLPWAIAATPDASTVALIAQETDSDDTTTAHYGRVRALIYHPGDFKTAASAWPISNAFEIDAPTVPGWSSRFVALDPDARVLLYWSSASTTVMRYDSRDGKSLGSLELGRVTARSRDGQRVAAVSSTGRLLVYDLVSGNTLLNLADKPASAMCFSADGSLLIVAAQANNLITYDVASGRVRSAVGSQLLPLAYPSRGNRFLAFQPDTSGTGGSIVLADTADARVAAVLNRAGNTFTPAFFSDSGDQLALVRNRSYAEVVRSLHPSELSAMLNTGLRQTAEVQPLAPANIVTATAVPIVPGKLARAANPDPSALRAEDMPALLSHLGNEVTVEGLVGDVTFTAAGNAMHIEFIGRDDRALLIWVPQGAYPKLIAALGENPGRALKNQTIRVTGRLAYYDGRRAAWKDRPQITLDDPSKLRLVAPAAQVDTTNALPVVPLRLALAASADPNALQAEDIPALLSHLGNEATVEGRVRDVILTDAGNAMNLEFVGPNDRALLVWVPPGAYSKLIAVLGPNSDQALKDHTIRVTGRLAHYGGRRAAWKDRPQITLKDPSKLLLIAPAAQSN